MQMLTELADAVALFIDMDCDRLPPMACKDHALYPELLKAQEVIRQARNKETP